MSSLTIPPAALPSHDSLGPPARSGGNPFEPTPGPIPACPALLERNLRFIEGRSAAACRLIRAARPHSTLELFAAADGALTGTLAHAGVRRQLASRRAPVEEAERLAASVDLSENAAVIVRGFGLGHHVAALARRIRRNGAVFVYEPDARLLRAVLERVDFTPIFAECPIIVFTESDTATLAAGVQGVEGLLAAGTTILDHPPSKARIADSAEAFTRAFTDVVKSVRTHIVTTLVQVETTVRNAVQNLRWYASAPGVADLAGCAKGSPAVIVAAGPSLRRNMHLLAEPGVRERVVIIAVQTVLKQLLAAGIRPHFVTALDYHEISRRFYEGLSAADVEGITLVVEPKCSPAILAAWPGALRCVGDDVPDRFLGRGLARETGRITPGATVAHLAYYLARHMNCDPAILIGQDLGFTDGQYYAPGAAIHRVWAGELGEFNTLEMLEWQRIMRMRSLLRKAVDVHGRDIYTDEQMSTYLVQFERDFAKDAELGWTTIDATEGGVLKRHTTPRTLREALDAAASAPPHRLPPTPAPLANRERLVAERLADLRRQTARIERTSEETIRSLREMQRHADDHRRVNALIEKVQRHAREVAALDAYWPVQFINQTGQLRRFRADRAIDLDHELSPVERQRRQIERDIDNVTWLKDAAAHLGSLLDEGLTTARGASPVTRDPSADSSDVRVTGERRRRVAACIAPGGDPTLLQNTLRRLRECRELDAVVVLGDGPEGCERADFDPDLWHDWSRSVRLARAWSRHCWRGGIANLTVYDEVCCPRILAPVMEARGLDAAVFVGAEWTLIDPALVDTVIARHRERPEGHPLTFTQAPPGLAACLVSRNVIAESARAGGPHATIGGLLGYIPIAPQADPITKPVCPSIAPEVRDILARCIPDSPARTAALGPYAGLTAAEIAERLAHDPRARCPAIETLTLDARYAHGATADRIAAFAESSGELAVTIDARRSPARLAVALARTIGAINGVAAVHVRTRLAGGAEDAEALLDSGAGVISIDMHTETGWDEARITEGVDHLLRSSPAGACGLPARWIVPRITRRDAVYGEIERFYDRWLLAAGACVIDPLEHASEGERISPLPPPPNVRDRRIQSHVEIGS
ncbi:MAG: motility associated factor glycosyltransferase family protein [Phycisphaerae bacterium]|nr:motility associated factor glycosyltransferase family protein [Phycisphaerae bacterium]